MHWRASFSRWLAGLCFAICLLLLSLPHAAAQETGQICVRSFDDRDRNGLRDADEGAVAHGVGASVHKLDGVTIGAALLEDSPFAADGLLCFDDLPAGDYRLRLTSAEFASTTATAFEAAVRPGSAPPLLEFGLTPLFDGAESRGRAPFALDADAIDALTRVMAGGLIVIASLAVCGLAMAVFLFRRRSQRMARRHREGASAQARQTHRAGAGSPPHFADDATDAPGKSD